jgi:hypothetical protein
MQICTLYHCTSRIINILQSFSNSYEKKLAMTRSRWSTYWTMKCCGKEAFRYKVWTNTSIRSYLHAVTQWLKFFQNKTQRRTFGSKEPSEGRLKKTVQWAVSKFISYSAPNSIKHSAHEKRNQLHIHTGDEIRGQNFSTKTWKEEA